MKPSLMRQKTDLVALVFASSANSIPTRLPLNPLNPLNTPHRQASMPAYTDLAAVQSSRGTLRFILTLVLMLMAQDAPYKRAEAWEID